MDDIIDKAGALNVQKKEIEKALSEYNAKIKERGSGTYDGNKFKAIVSVRTSKRLNQQKTLDVIKKLNAKWLLKEVIDEEKLEDAIASGEIDGKEFADCIDVSTTTAVTFKVKKGA